MNDPQIMSIAKNLFDNPNTKEAQAVQPIEAPPTGEGFSIPPDILAKLPQMMSALSSMGIGAPSPAGDDKKNASGNTKSKNHQRKALLSALRPYMSEKRCAVIDGLIQFEGLWDILGALNNSSK